MSIALKTEIYFFQRFYFSEKLSELEKRMARQDISSTILALEEELNRELISRQIIRDDHNILSSLRQYLQPFVRKIKANRLQRRIRERGDFDRMPVEIQQNIEINPPRQRQFNINRVLAPQSQDFVPAPQSQDFVQVPNFERAAQPRVDFSPFLHGIFASLNTHQVRQPESKQSLPVAHLEHLTFSSNSGETECGICRVDFVNNENIVKTSCCGTKFMHINCALQCLRRSEECPFCRSQRIGFL